MLNKRLWNLAEMLNDKVKLYLHKEEKLACGPTGDVIQHNSRLKRKTAPNSIASSG